MSLLAILRWLRVLWPVLAYCAGWALVRLSGLG